ncbi:MAG: alpha/beta hydrolase [Alphaproteobacteria bacterium]
MTASDLDRLLTSFRKRWNRSGQSLEESRASLTALEAFLPVAEDAIVATVSASGIPAEWVRASNVEADVDKALLYLHGSGYCYIAAPAPTACWPTTVPGHRREMPVAGLSPGPRAPLPGSLATLSPWTNLTMSGGKIQGLAEADPLVQPINLERCANWYMGDGDRSELLASPLLGELAGLPPLLVQVGSEEILLDDAVRLAARAEQAGVTVEYECWPQMFHVFQLYAPVLSESREAITAVGTFVNQHISLPAGQAGRRQCQEVDRRG